MAMQAADLVPGAHAFATRLALACGMAQAPARGRQAWLRRRLAETGAVVSAQAVNRWFHGAAMPARGKESAVAAALNVSPAWLFSRIGGEPPTGGPVSDTVAAWDAAVPSFADLLMNAPFDGREFDQSYQPMHTPDS